MEFGISFIIIKLLKSILLKVVFASTRTYEWIHIFGIQNLEFEIPFIIIELFKSILLKVVFASTRTCE